MELRGASISGVSQALDFLFLKMKGELSGHHFESDDDVISAVNRCQERQHFYKEEISKCRSGLDDKLMSLVF